jgi:hypothetical protein
MLAPVYCNGCGRRLDIPAGYAKGKIRCNECGVFSDVPKEVREAGQAASAQAEPASYWQSVPESQPAPPATAAPPTPAAADPADEALDEPYSFSDEPEPPARRPAAAPPQDDVPEKEVLIHGTEEDDLNPYTVTGDAATKRCPECDKKSPVRAKVCVNCGFHFESGEKAKRSYEPIRREWENGWPLQRRMMVFIILQVINFVTLIISLFNFSPGISLSMILFTVGLQAFLCGTYDKLSISRSIKGKVTLTTTWRYAFFERPPKTHRWKEHDSVVVVMSNDFDPFDWAFAFILLGYCVLPGLIFWWFVIHRDKYTVFLCKDHGFPETAIFRTLSKERAEEVRDAVSQITTLPVVTR